MCQSSGSTPIFSSIAMWGVYTEKPIRTLLNHHCLWYLRLKMPDCVKVIYYEKLFMLDHAMPQHIPLAYTLIPPKRLCVRNINLYYLFGTCFDRVVWLMNFLDMVQWEGCTLWLPNAGFSQITELKSTIVSESMSNYLVYLSFCWRFGIGEWSTAETIDIILASSYRSDKLWTFRFTVMRE